MRFDANTRDLILRSAAKARQMGHSYVGSVHLLLALGECTGPASALLRGGGFDPALAGNMALILYGRGTAGLPLPQSWTVQAQQILRGASREAKCAASREVHPWHLLAALLRQEKCAARDLLILSGVDSDTLFTRLAERIAPAGEQPYRVK